MSEITLKGLASHLGLSVSTISRALSDHPDISSDTKKIVLKTANDLGYQPNILARNLKSKYSNQIGIIIPEIVHDFFSKAISGIESVAYNEGFSVIISQSNEDCEREKINASSLYNNRVAGLIVSLSQTTKNINHFKELVSKGVKIVFFDRVFDGLDTYQVVIDDFKASYDAVTYLFSKGYRKICHFVGPQTLLNCKDRYLGYQKAISDNGLVFNEDLVVFGGMHEEDGVRAVKSLLERRVEFDSIFTVNDPVAIGALFELKSLGFKVPDEVAIVGFSNNPITGYISPSITTIEQPAYNLGQKAAQILIALIKGEDISEMSKKIVLPTKLIIRNSA